MVVGRRDLDHVRSDDVQRVEHPQHEQQLTARQPADLRRAGTRCEGRIQDVDVDGQVDREIPDPLLDLLGRGLCTDTVNVAAADHLEPEVSVLLEIDGVIDRTPGTDVDGVVLDEQALLEGPTEDRAVGDRGVELGVPGVKVGVEVDQRHRTVLGDRGPQQRQGDRVVAADTDQPTTVLVPQALGRMALDLLHGLRNAVGGAGDVTGVHDLQLAERCHVEFDVESGADQAGRLTHTDWCEPRSGPVGGAVVKGDAQHSDVIVADSGDVRHTEEGRGAGIAGHGGGVDGTDRVGDGSASHGKTFQWRVLEGQGLVVRRRCVPRESDWQTR